MSNNSYETLKQYLENFAHYHLYGIFLFMYMYTWLSIKRIWKFIKQTLFFGFLFIY